MNTDKRWADPIQARKQSMPYICLEELLSLDHPIRVVDDILSKLDWSAWEEHYSGDRRGQPLIETSFACFK